MCGVVAYVSRCVLLRVATSSPCVCVCVCSCVCWLNTTTWSNRLSRRDESHHPLVVAYRYSSTHSASATATRPTHHVPQVGPHPAAATDRNNHNHKRRRRRRRRVCVWEVVVAAGWPPQPVHFQTSCITACTLSNVHGYRGKSRVK